MRQVLTSALALHEKRVAHVLVTLISIRGAAPSDLGSKMLVTEAGLEAGSVGGGKVEARAIEYALHLLKDRSSPNVRTEKWNLQTDIGMTCGGEVTLLFERVWPSQWKIAIFGAGHVAQALTRVLLTLDCHIQCIDPRAEWLDKLEKHPQLEKILLPHPTDHVATLDSSTFILSLTQGHAFDVPILEAVLKREEIFPYVGVIGSSQKATRIKSELAAKNISPEKLNSLHCPMGLPFGSNHPPEIAISITAQLLSVRPTFVDPATRLQR